MLRFMASEDNSQLCRSRMLRRVHGSSIVAIGPPGLRVHSHSVSHVCRAIGYRDCGRTFSVAFQWDLMLRLVRMTDVGSPGACANNGRVHTAREQLA